MARAWLIIAASLLVDCDGGSSDFVIPGGGDTADLTVLVGGTAVDTFDEAVMTVESVQLVMDDGGDETLLDIPVDIELLTLGNVTEVLLIEDVADGRIDAIRFDIGDLVLRRFDGDVLREEVRPRLLAEGRVDAKPRVVIDVDADDELVLEVVFDLARSLEPEASGSGDPLFRPVVFVEELTAFDPSRLARLGGIVRGQERAFDLCDLERFSDEDDRSDVSECVLLDLGEAVTVSVDTAGTIVDDGAEANDPAIVFGFMREDDGDRTREDDDDAPALGAVLVALGSPETWDTVAGTVVSAPVDDRFELAVDGSIVTVNLADAVQVFDSRGEPLDDLTGALRVGTAVEIFGLADDAVEAIDALMVLVGLDRPGALLEGRVTDVLATEFRVDVDDQAAEGCVAFDNDTTFFSVMRDDDAIASLEVDDRILTVSAEVDVFGTPVGDEDDCGFADLVVVEDLDGSI